MLKDIVVFQEFQGKVSDWVREAFGDVAASDTVERNHRFLEEALELVQSIGCTREDAHTLVDYVFDRPVGDPHQEVGGVLVTLMALCSANHINAGAAGNAELRRVWAKIEQIRAKQAAKPNIGPLPQ